MCFRIMLEVKDYDTKTILTKFGKEVYNKLIDDINLNYWINQYLLEY